MSDTTTTPTSDAPAASGCPVHVPAPVAAAMGGCPVDHSAMTGSDPATRAFNRSMLISGTRCLLTYVVFPWILPLLGLTASVGPALGIAIGLVALGCDVFTIRRFWVFDHKWKWPVTVICSGVIVMLLFLLVEDVAELLS
jgi:hypothetical protein